MGLEGRTLEWLFTFKCFVVFLTPWLDLYKICEYDWSVSFSRDWAISYKIPSCFIGHSPAVFRRSHVWESHMAIVWNYSMASRQQLPTAKLGGALAPPTALQSCLTLGLESGKIMKKSHLCWDYRFVCLFTELIMWQSVCMNRRCVRVLCELHKSKEKNRCFPLIFEGGGRGHVPATWGGPGHRVHN